MSNYQLKVLVADDASIIHTILGRIAERSPSPFTIVSAYDGRQCAELLNKGGIDLAFIDVNMPEMTGMQAVGAARYAGNKTFVTLMSADSSAPRLRRHALLFKVYEFLHKPFQEDDVRRSCGPIVGSRRRSMRLSSTIPRRCDARFKKF